MTSGTMLAVVKEDKVPGVVLKNIPIHKTSNIEEKIKAIVPVP